jgi:2-polyprenyl-3-methyl-5-hydroxy-6-metoxy-1,4-benzoquinol methylase
LPNKARIYREKTTCLKKLTKLKLMFMLLVGGKMTQSPAPNLNVFMNYDYEIDLAGDSAGAAVIRFVKPTSKVLEIGAGSGAIAKHLVSTNKCKLTALENNSTSVEKLKKFADSVHDLDLNDVKWPKALAKQGKFDHVIAADVLEHVYDPWTVLAGMKTMLNDTGSIILSLPHAAHSAVLTSFYNGDVEYREWGLLDKTHIRFFGFKNVEGLYESAGLAIVRCHFVMKKPHETEFSEHWKALPDNVREALGQRNYSDVYQIVTEAVPIERAANRITLESCLPPQATYKPSRRFFNLFGK